MEENQEIKQENKINEKNKSNQSLEDKKPKKIKKSLKQILNETYQGVSGLAFTSAVTGASAYVLFGHSNAVQEKIIQKCAENPGYISGLIQNALNAPLGYESLAAVSLTGICYASANIAEKLNPIYNILNFGVNKTRDYLGEEVIAGVAPFSKLRKIISTKRTYGLNIAKDKKIMEIRKEKLENKMDKLQTKINNLQTNINKLQKLKIGYQDLIVKNPEFYKEKIINTNNQIKELYRKKEVLEPATS